MATITATVTAQNNRTWIALWTAMGNADNGTGVLFAQYVERTIGVVGTFGGATVTVEGSMDNTNWVTLKAAYTGTAITFAAAGIAVIAENPTYIRARTSGGAGTAVDVYLIGAGR